MQLILSQSSSKAATNWRKKPTKTQIKPTKKVGFLEKISENAKKIAKMDFFLANKKR
jgi:hypothetical protein